MVTGAKPHKALLSRLQRLSRSLSRKIKISKNRDKAKAKLVKLHKLNSDQAKEQATYLDKACGSRWHCYNQLLAHFKDNKWSKSAAYQYYINVIRKEFAWYTEVSSRVTAIDDLDNAFKHFFRRVKAKQKAGKYFASILIETQEYNPKNIEHQPSVGVDFGIKNLATL